MTHSDDDGFVCPPRIAPAHVVILPILFKAEDPAAVLEYCRKLAAEIGAQTYAGRPIEVELDTRDSSGGDKLWGWIKKGIPLRLEVGPRDIASDTVFMGRRDKPAKEKKSVTRAEFVATVAQTLDDIQTSLFEKAKAFRAEHTRVINAKDKVLKFFSATSEPGKPTPIHGGFAWHFCGDRELEEQIRKSTA